MPYKLYSNIQLIATIIFCIFAGFAFLLSYKEEKLLCDVSTNECYVYRTTYLNDVNKIRLMHPRDVNDVIIVESDRRVRNNHRKRETSRYILKFVSFDGKEERIFSSDFPSYSTAVSLANQIKSKFKSGNNIIEVSHKKVLDKKSFYDMIN